MTPEAHARFLRDQTPEIRRWLARDWLSVARPEQIEPEGDWRYWVILAGRGFGKTRSGAEWVRERVKRHRFVNLIGATADDARDILVEGESGILAICRDEERPEFRKSERKLLWPNGAVSLIFTADEPDRLRGKQHEALWGDELAAWRYVDEAWAQAMFGLRLGDDPRAVITTTPRPIKALRELLADPHTVPTRGSTYENRANLAPAFYDAIIKRYEGTRLGRQELNAELLLDNPDALWSQTLIDDLRVKKAPALKRIVVGVDPAVTSGEDSNETGIIVAGLGVDGHGYVLDDRTRRAKPAEWAAAVAMAYHDWKADRVVAEVNNGGELVEAVVRTVAPRVSYKGVRAARGKVTRAEPVSSLYEKGHVHHCGYFAQLESQMTDWVPGMPSPDRMDALCWAIHELMLAGRGGEAHAF
jgi:predicted phage terminase large subunit-like protein